MPSAFNIIPDDYEIITTLDVSGAVREYIASYKPDKTLVHLRVYSFTDTTDTAMCRHLRNYLRKDVGFIEELNHPNIVQLFDFSETRQQFWVATQPANINKLSECFPKIASSPLETRVSLVKKLLSTIEYIHNCGIVHRNISSNGVFWDSELELYVGDFGLACHLADVPTSIHDTTPTSTSGATYQAPEIKDAKTTFIDVRCDIFSAGLLAIEILNGSSVPKDIGRDFHRTLKQYLEQQGTVKSIGAAVFEVLFKAISLDPAKRWPTIKNLSDVFSKTLKNKPADNLTFIDLAGTIDATQALQSSDKPDEAKPTEEVSGKERPEEAPVARAPILPSGTENEIWNSRYEIIEKIGGGGQAVVYKALDHLTNEEIAIKTLLSRHKKDKSAINRLKQEAMVARSLTHKYIVKTYSVEQRTDTADGSEAVFLCMELITSGLELKDVINSRRAAGQGFELGEVLHISRQLLEALKYAHSYTIHRDVKPGNIMLVPHEDWTNDDTSDLTRFDIRLMDFGIAKVLTQKRIEVTGKGFWSAHYGAPELADAKSTVDARADLYSVGVIIYQMLTGHIPRKGSPSANKVNKNVPTALATVVDKAINADRENRFKSAAVLVREIEKAVSKFNWIWKTIKVTAVLLLVTLIGTGVSYFWPEPEYLPIRENVAILAERDPFNAVASFADNNIIRYTDLEGFESYDKLRKNAIEKLEDQLNEWGQEEFPRSTRCWKNQEEIWLEMEPKVNNLKQIQYNQQQYNQLKDLAVFTHLLELDPSSKVLSKIQGEIKTAETLLKERPLSKETLNTCDNIYNLAAKVYVNVEGVAGELDINEAAERINERLNNVKQLRERFLSAQNNLNKISQLKNENFQEWSDRCLTKADSYYSGFELETAEQYFNLLSQICGTVSDVRNQIDFAGSDIALIVSRLMQLCHENIETFESYPEWKGKLESVHEKKDLLAKYITLLGIIETEPKQSIPKNIYVSLLSAREERDNVQVAKKRLNNAASEYKEFLTKKVNNLEALSVTHKDIENYKEQLQVLSSDITGSEWPEVEHVQKYKGYSVDIKDSLMKEGLDLRRKIVDKVRSAQVEYSWKSGTSPQYMNIARHYTGNDIAKSIDGWKHIDNVQRISSIIIQMRDIDALLTRRQQLDRLAGKIDEGIDFCEKFRGASPEEKEQQQQWLSDLKNLKQKLTAKYDDSELIDLEQKMFDSNWEGIDNEYKEIQANFPYYSNRVEQLINEAEFIESTGEYINGALSRWRSVIAQDSAVMITFRSSTICNELQSIKENVNSWTEEQFNQEIQPKCKILENIIEQEGHIIVTILRVIKALDERIDNILSNEDVRELNAIAAQNDKKTILEELKDSFERSENVLRMIQDVPENVSLAYEHADFVISTWLENYNKTRTQLKTQITQLQTIEENISKDIAMRLAQELPIEQSYYADLKNAVVKVVSTHHSNIENEIMLVEQNGRLIKMYDFLEKMGDETIPKLTNIKQSHSDNNMGLTKIQSFAIEDLGTVKEFNIRRKELVQQFVTLGEDIKKYNESDLESACKKTVLDVPNYIKKLIEQTGQVGKIDELCALLWSFYSEHKDWGQWQYSFQDLFHITISSDDQLQFTSLHGFQPADNNGNVVVTSMVVSNPANFFYIDTGEVINFGWPKYAKADGDPNVKLTFVPSGTGNPEPFYMATYEITNAQYKRFLVETGAKASQMKKWSHFLNQDNQTLVQWTPFDGEPQCDIRLDDSGSVLVIAHGKENTPMTWVTYQGAQSYATWLGAQLPTASQHEYACRAGTNSLYPWGDNLSPISNFAHVRAVAWQHAASEYNSQIDNPLEIAHAPVGAVTDYQDENKTLDTGKFIHNKAVYNSAWPISNANKPNSWGLYDMIGNVWEWCKNDDNEDQTVICGGSCLSPPEYVYPDSKYQFQGKACDVGFRVIVPPK